MTRKTVGVTDAELAVLKVLWARGPLAAKAITEAIYPDGAESEFAAVHSFLQRLERKGLVVRDRGSFVHIFSAAVLASRNTRAGAEHSCRSTGQRVDRALDHAAHSSKATQQERGGRDSQAPRQVHKVM